MRCVFSLVRILWCYDILVEVRSYDANNIRRSKRQAGRQDDGCGVSSFASNRARCPLGSFIPYVQTGTAGLCAVLHTCGDEDIALDGTGCRRSGFSLRHRVQCVLVIRVLQHGTSRCFFTKIYAKVRNVNHGLCVLCTLYCAGRAISMPPNTLKSKQRFCRSCLKCGRFHREAIADCAGSCLSIIRCP